MRIPPGFTFRPTDQELVGFYLQRWIAGLPIPKDTFHECDVYAAEPDKLLGGRQRAYFFAMLKPSKSLLVPRRAGLGTWMLNGCKEGEPIKAAAPGGAGGTVVIGYKRNLSFHLDKIKKAAGFVMDEYSPYNLANDDKGQRVVCVIRQTKNAKRKGEKLEEAAGAKRKREMLEASPLPPSAGLLPFCDSHMGPSEELMLQDKERLEAEYLPLSAGAPPDASLEDDLWRFCDSLLELSEEPMLQHEKQFCDSRTELSEKQVLLEKEQLEAAYLPPSASAPADASLDDGLQQFFDSLFDSESSKELMLQHKKQMEVASLPPSPGVPAVASFEDDLQQFCDSPWEPSEELMLQDKRWFTEMMDDLLAVVEGRHRF